VQSTGKRQSLTPYGAETPEAISMKSDHKNFEFWVKNITESIKMAVFAHRKGPEYCVDYNCHNFTSFRKSDTKSSNVTSNFKPEVDMWSFLGMRNKELVNNSPSPKHTKILQLSPFIRNQARGTVKQ